jgi:hypothetical protein
LYLFNSLVNFLDSLGMSPLSNQQSNTAWMCLASHSF